MDKSVLLNQYLSSSHKPYKPRGTPLFGLGPFKTISFNISDNRVNWIHDRLTSNTLLLIS